MGHCSCPLEVKVAARGLLCRCLLVLQAIKAVEMGLSVSVIVGGVIHTSALPTSTDDYGQHASTGVYKRLPSGKNDPQRVFGVMEGVGPWKDAMDQAPEQLDNKRVGTNMMRFMEVLAKAAAVSALAAVVLVNLVNACVGQ